MSIAYSNWVNNKSLKTADVLITEMMYEKELITQHNFELKKINKQLEDENIRINARISIVESKINKFISQMQGSDSFKNIISMLEKQLAEIQKIKEFIETGFDDIDLKSEEEKEVIKRRTAGSLKKKAPNIDQKMTECQNEIIESMRPGMMVRNIATGKMLTINEFRELLEQQLDKMDE
jgi:hypothetical protein